MRYNKATQAWECKQTSAVYFAPQKILSCGEQLYAVGYDCKRRKFDMINMMEITSIKIAKSDTAASADAIMKLSSQEFSDFVSRCMDTQKPQTVKWPDN